MCSYYSPPKTLLVIFQYIYRVRSCLMQHHKAKGGVPLRQRQQSLEEGESKFPDTGHAHQKIETLEAEKSPGNENDQEREEAVSDGVISGRRHQSVQRIIK